MKNAMHRKNISLKEFLLRVKTKATRKKVGKEKIGTRETKAQQTKTQSRTIFNGLTQAGIILRRPNKENNYLVFRSLATFTASLPMKLPFGSDLEKMGLLTFTDKPPFPFQTITTNSLMMTHPTIPLCLFTPPHFLTDAPGFPPEPMNSDALSSTSRLAQ
jgi:hypothetical protein